MIDRPLPEGGPLVYAEFFRKRSGVSLETFHRIAGENFREWSSREPEDELLASLGRTWRMGPFPYLLLWRCRGIDRLDEWNDTFQSGTVDDLEKPLLEVLVTEEAGFYRELVTDDVAAPDDQLYYLETFTPWDGATENYRRRADRHGAQGLTVLERVGRLGPQPGGIALMRVGALSHSVRFQDDLPHEVDAVGLYAPTGREIL